MLVLRVENEELTLPESERVIKYESTTCSSLNGECLSDAVKNQPLNNTAFRTVLYRSP